jgi:hypothetical protein
MTYKKINTQDEEFRSSTEYEFKSNSRKNLIIYTLKRIFYYLTILHGAITIIFLILVFPADNRLVSIEFYLYFSLISFIIYGFIAYSTHVLQKSYIRPITQEPIEPLQPEMKLKPDIAKELLQGKTLLVYWYLFTHRHAGIREIQKALKIQSSGTVAYQITKLLNAEVISKNDADGKYVINKEIKIGVLKFFMHLGNRMIPRLSLYLIIYILGFIVFLILTLIHGYKFLINPLSLFLLFFLIFGTIIFLIESYKIRKLDPTR